MSCNKEAQLVTRLVTKKEAGFYRPLVIYIY
jgi:hypothetical protein